MNYNIGFRHPFGKPGSNLLKEKSLFKCLPAFREVILLNSGIFLILINILQFVLPDFVKSIIFVI
jgi:uncharacterized membrane protein SirB2